MYRHHSNTTEWTQTLNKLMYNVWVKVTLSNNVMSRIGFYYASYTQTLYPYTRTCMCSEMENDTHMTTREMSPKKNLVAHIVHTMGWVLHDSLSVVHDTSSNNGLVLLAGAKDTWSRHEVSRAALQQRERELPIQLVTWHSSYVHVHILCIYY